MAGTPEPKATYAAHLREGVRATVAKTLPRLDAGMLEDMMRQLFALGEATVATLRCKDPPKVELACGAGCAHCCRLYVQVTPLEAIHLATKVIGNRTSEQLKVLKQRVAGLDEKTHGLGTAERAHTKLACALLEDERCTAYEDRPFPCRGANSANARFCEDTLEGGNRVLSYLHQWEAWSTLGNGTAEGLKDAGHDPVWLELTAALRLALEHDDPLAAWQSGALDFAPARCQEADRRAAAARA